MPRVLIWFSDRTTKIESQYHGDKVGLLQRFTVANFSKEPSTIWR